MLLTKYLSEIVDNLKSIKFFKKVDFLKSKYEEISWKSTKATIKIYQLERSARVVMELYQAADLSAERGEPINLPINMIIKIKLISR